jgi:hypothetical protein
MSPEAQRIAIAEACPKIARLDSGRSWWLDRGEYDSSACYVDSPFDPINDLNAMHEAEKVLTNYQHEQRGKWILEIMNETAVGYVSDYASQLRSLSRVASATAAQRAEAFLRTLNLWDDSK